MQNGIVHVSGGGGYPPGGGGPPGGGWGPPPGAPPGGGGYGPPPGGPPGYGPPGGGPPPGAPPGGGWGPPPGSPPGGPPPGAPPGYGPPGAPPGYGPPGAPPGYGPPGAPPGYVPPGAPGAPPGGGLPPGYVPPGAPPPGVPPTQPGYGPPGGPPPGGYGPPGGGGYGPPAGAPPGYGPPGQQPPPPAGSYGGGGYGPPGGPPPGWGGPPPGGFVPPGAPPGAGWSPTEAIGFGWNALTKNFAGVSLPIATAMVVAILPGQILTWVYAALATVVADVVDPSFIGVLGYLVQGTASLLGLFIGSYISGGISSFVLKVARGQPVAFGEVFSGGKYFGSMFVATLGMYVAVAIGMVLCIVPGYILLLGLCMYSFLIVDQGLGGIDALKRSWEMTKGHKLNIFLFGLLGFLVIIAGAIACGIGVLLGSYPVLMTGAAYIYLKIKGEQPRLA